MESTEHAVVEAGQVSELVEKVDMETAQSTGSETEKSTSDISEEKKFVETSVSEKGNEDDSRLVNPSIQKSEKHKSMDCGDKNSTDNCDICINTANEFTTVAESSAGGDKEIKKKAFELVESVNSQEETSDDSNEEEMQQFLDLMNKATRKNQRKISAVQTFHFGAARNNHSDWRNVNMEEPGSDTTDTDDEDDNMETRRFLSLMGNAKQKPVNRPMVTIKWQDGKVVGLPDNIKVTRVPPGQEVRSRHEEELIRRRKEHMETVRRDGPISTVCSGKRKFEDRMTLSEAKAEDFTDTKDYVDFIQAKLKNVNIKIIK